MCDRCYVESDPFFLTEPSKSSLGKVCAIIRNDAMRIAISQDNVLEERHSRVAVTFPYRLNFYPLGELIHHHQHVGHVATSRFECSHHVQTPHSKWPCDGNSLECSSRHMNLIGIHLASVVFSDDILCFLQSSWPI